MKKAVILISIFLTALTGLVFGQNPSASQNLKSQAELASVRIMSGNFDNERIFRPTQSGSGAIISSEGLIVTSREVVLDAQGRVHPEIWAGVVNPKNRGLSLNRAYKLTLVKESKQYDLALLQIQTERKRKFLSYNIGSTDELSYGDYLGVIGFPNSRVTVSDCELLGMDDTGAWLYAEGSFLKGMLGSSVVNENGELVGIAVKAVDNQKIPFFDDTNSPIGEVVLDKVGMIRSIETVMDFVRPNTQFNFPVVNQISGVEVEGAITQTGTSLPIRNAAIGILAFSAMRDGNQIETEDLLGYARSDNLGKFKINRKLRPGKYLVKVVAPGYQTVIKEITVPLQSGRLLAEMSPVKR